MYPHGFLCGMRQRVMIAMALAVRARRADCRRGTTALDVTVQAQILILMRELQRDFGTAIVMITHDLGVVAGLCDEVMVLYGGQVMEQANADAIFYRPSHPIPRVFWPPPTALERWRCPHAGDSRRTSQYGQTTGGLPFTGAAPWHCHKCGTNDRLCAPARTMPRCCVPAT